MSSPGLRLLSIVGAGILILASASSVGAADGGTSVTITSPRSGQSVSLKRAAYTAVAGDVAFSPTTATTTRFFLRRDGCGTSNDNPHLSIASGTDAGDGCGVCSTPSSARAGTSSRRRSSTSRRATACPSRSTRRVRSPA